MSAAQTLREFVAKASGLALWDEASGVLMDVPSGRPLPLRAERLAAAELHTDRVTQAPWLLLKLEDGRVVGLTANGVAFAPAFRSTGPLPELPQAVCWRDYFEWLGRVKHALYGHPDTELDASVVRATMCCLAMLDGAHDAGFDISADARELELHLTELERRAPPAR